MIKHTDIDQPGFRQLIKDGSVAFGGNAVLKIYGTLRCASGKRMHRKNRVFFRSIAEARAAGYRPCGHCMKEAYDHWKNSPKK